jgi:hypothetical protein
VLGNAAPGTQVRLYGDAGCTGSPLASGTAAELAGQGIPITVAFGKTTQIRAQAVDADDQLSACSTPLNYTAETLQRPDAEPPETTIRRKPSYTGPKNSHFAFRSSEAGSTFRCSLDGTRFRDCKSPKNYRNLEKGRHVFRVMAVDPAGNADPTPARQRFRIAR